VRIGELFAGYGGLGMGVQAALGGEIAWVSEVDKGANKILAHRFPGVPNHGDITTIDWAQVEPVDVLTGGSPCQDLSHAGRRAGMTEGTRSNLWVAMREAIAHLRPGLVVWENVGGVASAQADSDLERQPGLLAGVRRRDGQPLLRALGRVVGDLSSLGYVGRVGALRAADVGAPHGRLRYFLSAWPAADAERRGRDGWSPHAVGESLGRASAARSSKGALLPTPTVDDSSNLTRASGEFQSLTRTVSLLPTPRATEMEESPETFLARQERMAEAGRTRGDSGMPLNVAVALLPTPAVNDMGASYTPETWDEWTARMRSEHANGNGHGKSLEIEAQRLGNGPHRYARRVVETEGPHDAPYCCGAYTQSWVIPDGTDYGAAVRRWHDLFRCVTPPSEVGPNGGSRLSPRFSEWMMGLPDGWVTDVPGITRNEALKACGNGVVPQQAAAALRLMLGANEVAA
jgi:DNA (cytosine-5)-methyltransferase 1